MKLDQDTNLIAFSDRDPAHVAAIAGDDSLSKDTIPLDIETYIERLVVIAMQSDPALLAQEEHRAQVWKEIEAFRQDAQQAVAPHVKPTRVACKRCYFRVRHTPPMWRDFCLMGLIRRQCGAIAFASDATLWDEMEARVRGLSLVWQDGRR